MDSINKNQPEHNKENLLGKEAVEKIKDLANKGVCFFCTNIQTGKRVATRPMSVQKIDDDGNLWFLSAKDSHKNAEIADDSAVQLMFKGSNYSDFLDLYGKAEITTNKAKIEELWEPMVKAWFTEGKDDPRITVIKFKPTAGYYWDNKNGNVVALVKTAIGAMLGKTLDDSVEGNLKIRQRS